MLFWILVIVFIIYYVRKQSTVAGNQRANRPVSQTAEAEKTVKMASRSVSAADRQRLEEYRARKEAQRAGGYAAPTATAAGRSAAGYPVKKASAAAANQKTDILARAQQNAKKYEADVTLEELELDHDHTERSKRTISKEELAKQKAMHPHDAAHVSEAISAESESILGTIEDLMVKGYDGNLSFERDFVGEGMDMISRFTVPDTIPGAGSI